LLAHGRWFSPGTPVSSITKTGSHDIAEILLNVALNNMKQTNKYRLLGREWLIIDQTMYKNLQYMSTVQVIPSYKQNQW
jgi:hypothetical protein